MYCTGRIRLARWLWIAAFHLGGRGRPHRTLPAVLARCLGRLADRSVLEPLPRAGPDRWCVMQHPQPPNSAAVAASRHDRDSRCVRGSLPRLPLSRLVATTGNRPKRSLGSGTQRRKPSSMRFARSLRRILKDPQPAGPRERSVLRLDGVFAPAPCSMRRACCRVQPPVIGKPPIARAACLTRHSAASRSRWARAKTRQSPKQRRKEYGF